MDGVSIFLANRLIASSVEGRNLDFIARATGGRVVQGNSTARVLRVSSDSRNVERGDLFAAIPGPRFDGHSYLAEVASKGASAVMVQAGRCSSYPKECAVIEVEEVRRALGQLGASYRSEFDLDVIAVAGSNGKTSTKELTAAVVRQRGPAIWSEASFNNDLGVPFTLLRIGSEHRTAVLEIGTNHPGELAPLIEWVAPRYGIITSIGREHLEHFKTIEGVLEEEGTLAERLPSNGVLFVNGEESTTPTLEKKARCRVVRVGWGQEHHWSASAVRVSLSGTQFEVRNAPPGYAGTYSTPLIGRHQVINALFAAAVGQELGLSPDQIRRGLSECHPPKSRLVYTERSGIGILDDSYNANADSMLAALRTLRDLPCTGRKIAVLGDMAELGENTEPAHREVGVMCARLGIDVLVGVGENAAITVEAAEGEGIDEVHRVANATEAVPLVESLLGIGDLVLIKASRSAGLERIAGGLKGPA